MEGNSTGRTTDLDSTDKLPTLAEDKLVKLDDRSGSPNGRDDTPSLVRSLAQLREVLGEETQRSRHLETRLDTQDLAIAKLQAEFEQEAERNSAARTSAEAASSQALATRELIGKVQIALRSLHSRVVSLETYIAGRPEGWREMEQALHSKSVRIAEAEAQLAEKIALLAEDLTAEGLDPAPTTDADVDVHVDTELEAGTDMNADIHTEVEASMDADVDTTLEPLAAADTFPNAGAELASPEADSDADEDEGLEKSLPERRSALVGGTADAPIAYAITKDSITIGRDPEADISIPAVSVSRYHATVTIDGPEAIIEDHSSTNGVFVNNERIQRRTLSSGDEVVIGDSRFRFFSGEARD